MELDNAINQAIREIDTRFDFKNTGAKIELTGDKLAIEAGTEERAKAALDVVKDKMIKRGVSLKHLETADPQLSGKIYKIACTLKEGISTENAKKIAKFLRDEGPKSIKTQIQGDELRVTSKSRDDLQEAIEQIKNGKFEFAVQFVNLPLSGKGKERILARTSLRSWRLRFLGALSALLAAAQTCQPTRDSFSPRSVDPSFLHHRPCALTST
jgi:cyclic-di-GMP-binding protein